MNLLARWTAPAVLVIVAAFQIVRVHTVEQSPWSGAGWGMFAVVDGEDTRWIRARFDPLEGDAHLVALPEDLEREAFEVRVLPTEERTHALARDLADRIGEPGQLVVEVWGPRLEEDPLRLAADLIERVRIEVSNGR